MSYPNSGLVCWTAKCQYVSFCDISIAKVSFPSQGVQLLKRKIACSLGGKIAVKLLGLVQVLLSFHLESYLLAFVGTEHCYLK